jgi:hypothetical protein
MKRGQKLLYGEHDDPVSYFKKVRNDDQRIEVMFPNGAIYKVLRHLLREDVTAEAAWKRTRAELGF